MFFGWRYEARRRRLLKKTPAGPVHEYLQHAWPQLDTPLDKLSMMALDLETSGLNPKQDEIVSIGWVLVDAGHISLSSAEHFLVKPSQELPSQSVIIHGIGDDRAATGVSIEEALTSVLKALSGRVLVGHHIGMDAAFLKAACRGIGWGALAVPYVDTLSLLERKARLHQQPIVEGSFTLSSARANQSLPRYPAHNALWDAIAAAELWLAQSAELSQGANEPTLSSVLTIPS